MGASKWFFSLLLLAQAAYAVYTAYEIFYVQADYAQSITSFVEVMIIRGYPIPETYTGYLAPWLDFHINTVVVVFRNYFLIRPVQWCVLEFWFGGFLPTLVWMNMENERVGLIGAALYFSLYQMLGVSIFYPLVCIYYLLSSHRSSTKTNYANPLSSFFQIISVVIPMLIPFYLNDFVTLTYSLIAFIIAPCVIPLFTYFFFPSLDKVPAHREKTASYFFVALLGFAGALGFYLHIRAVLGVVADYWLKQEDLVFQWAKLWEDLLPGRMHDFLSVDLAVTFTTTFTMVWALGGFSTLLLVVIGTIFFGPALPLALFYISLEARKQSTAVSTRNNNTSNKKNN
eukprot:TRINITY_DN7363_c0_g1_i1.p1 TRINITY_DN7363_c0_g1~~TRINITY_DN7363_c0_g1_i1.p1  ORF type:complete len:355 (-),score=85.82 TRINITY_DN7363_c0_g1_i1:13-1038(-)